jgi:hypothetical protein
MVIKTQDDKNKALNRISMLVLDKPWEVEIKPYKKNRSVLQNRLYRLRLAHLEKEGPGYTADEWHIIFANMFLDPAIVNFKGKVYEVRQSTTKLNTEEFTNYLNKIDRWCVVEFGIILPSPEDLYYEAMGIRKSI